MTVLEIAGWAGSLLLVVSLLQSGMMRLRVLNLVASVVLVAYNLALSVWPMVAMNVAVALIDLVHILRLRAASRATAKPQQDS
jgi:hypothetical protein